MPTKTIINKHGQKIIISGSKKALSIFIDDIPGLSEPKALICPDCGQPIEVDHYDRDHGCKNIRDKNKGGRA